TSQADRTIATMIDHCAQELILLEHALHQLGRVVGYTSGRRHGTCKAFIWANRLIIEAALAGS
ncbi:MAG: hypothetical protein WCB61_07140, partial [Pseudolabrys sp.]